MLTTASTVMAPHEMWAHAVPRLLMAAWGTGLAAAVIIRLVFRPGRSYLSVSRHRAAHSLRLK